MLPGFISVLFFPLPIFLGVCELWNFGLVTRPVMGPFMISWTAWFD